MSTVAEQKPQFFNRNKNLKCQKIIKYEGFKSLLLIFFFIFPEGNIGYYHPSQQARVWLYPKFAEKLWIRCEISWVGGCRSLESLVGISTLGE